MNKFQKTYIYYLRPRTSCEGF